MEIGVEPELRVRLAPAGPLPAAPQLALSPPLTDPVKAKPGHTALLNQKRTATKDKGRGRTEQVRRERRVAKDKNKRRTKAKDNRERRRARQGTEAREFERANGSD